MKDIARCIFQSDIKICHCLLPLYEFICYACKCRLLIEHLLDCFSDICESRELDHAPAEGLRFLALLEKHKTRVIVEYPVAVCAVDLCSVSLVQLDSVAKSRRAGCVEHVSRSNEVPDGCTVVDDLPSLILVVHVGVFDSGERILLVHLHDALLAVRIGFVRRFDRCKRGALRELIVLGSDVLGRDGVSAFDFGLEHVHVLLHTDFREGMEVVSVINKFLTHVRLLMQTQDLLWS